MGDPGLYYVEEAAEVGKIVAVAPVPLREDDRLKNWIQMSISDPEYQMFTEGREVVTDWYVNLDQKTQLRTLVSKKTGGMPAVENLISARPIDWSLENPDYRIIELSGGLCLSLTEAVRNRGGTLDIWAVDRDNPLIVLDHQRIDLSEHEFQCFLFPVPTSPYVLYTNATTLRIGRCTT